MITHKVNGGIEESEIISYKPDHLLKEKKWILKLLFKNGMAITWLFEKEKELEDAIDSINKGRKVNEIKTDSIMFKLA